MIFLVKLILSSCLLKGNLAGNPAEPVSSTNFCTLISGYIDGFHPSVFEPYDSVYQLFVNSTSEVDIVFRRSGQVSEFRWIHQLPSGDYNFVVYGPDGLKDSQTLKTDRLKIPTAIGDYSFLCNPGKSDQPSDIYIFKSKGKIEGKIWLSNGRFRDLKSTDINHFDQIKELISLINK